MLVGLSNQLFRCLNCGTDLIQHVNGKIVYIPTISGTTIKSKLENILANFSLSKEWI